MRNKKVKIYQQLNATFDIAGFLDFVHGCFCFQVRGWETLLIPLETPHLNYDTVSEKLCF
jgi:hypothetical protein